MKNKNLDISFLALLQALGVAIYCALAAWFMWWSTAAAKTANMMDAWMVLLFFVLSVGVTATMVFGYPVTLALDKKYKDAGLLLGYTFIYLVVILAFVSMIARI